MSVLTAKNYSDVQRLRVQGLTLREIAEAVGLPSRSIRQMIFNLAKWGRLSSRRLEGWHPRPIHLEIKRLREQGMSFNTIAARMGRSRPSIEWHVDVMYRHGYLEKATPEQRRERHRQANIKVWAQRRLVGENLAIYTAAAQRVRLAQRQHDN